MKLSATLALLAALGLAACSSGGGDGLKDDGSVRPPPDESDVEAPPPDDGGIDETKIDPPDKVQPSGPMDIKAIKAALTNKTFQYSQGPKSGTISYFNDGTFAYVEKGKGDGTGIWEASDKGLCEAFDPTDFLPSGRRSECHPFTAGNGRYSTGPKKLTPT